MLSSKTISTLGCWLLLIAMLLFEVGCGKDHKGLTAAKGMRTFDCGDQHINIDKQNGVDKKAIYVCDKDSISWGDSSVGFTVHFVDTKVCQFNPCVDITDSTPKTVSIPQGKEFTVYKYSLQITNGLFLMSCGGGGLAV